MFQCPNCGGNAKFDVPSQQLACDYCGTKLDPYSFENKTKDAEEGKDPENYEVTIFTCPQCGGEILSTDNAAAGFCSFCGASTILYSRISNEHRPNYIIPFKKTKEDCKQAYSDMMKKAIFAPKELKDVKKIDSFRGIYMPYWAFYETQNGPISLKGEKSHRSGDYIITDHYQLTGNLDAYYKGLSYDASSSFADNISEAIAPYDVKGMKAFTPAFLSGFYADTADVAPQVYQPEVEAIACEQTVSKIKSEPKFRGYSMQTAGLEGNPAKLNTRTQAVDQAMFPVWFMSYRNGDRVAYATVNGQTGKVVADIPVDIKKFLLGALVLALPIFVLLNMLLTMIPSTVLTATGVLAAICMIISCVMIGKIQKHENGEEDKGFLARTNPQKLTELNLKNAKQKPKEKKNKPVVLVIFLGYIGMMIAMFFGTLFLELMGSGVFWIGILAVGLFTSIVGISKINEIPGKKGLFGMIISMCAVVFGAGVVLVHPVSDLFYYLATIILIASIIVMEKELIEQYNLTATRRLPQFDKQGGDDRA